LLTFLWLAASAILHIAVNECIDWIRVVWQLRPHLLSLARSLFSGVWFLVSVWHRSSLSLRCICRAVVVAMRFKNRYYLVELAWEVQQPMASSSATSASAGSASVAARSSAANPASASAAAASYAASPATASAAVGAHLTQLPSLSLRTVDPSLQAYTVQSAVRDALRDSFGDLTAGRCMQSLTVRYLNSLTNAAIIRVARADHRALAAALCFVTAIKGKSTALRTVHIGGTIRSCQKAALKLQRKRMAELHAQLAAAEAMMAGPEAATAAAPPAAVSAASSTAAAGLRDALTGATARTNQPVTRNAQQTLRQLANLLSTYRGTQAAAAAQQASGASASSASAAASTASLGAQLARGEQSVPPTVSAIRAALTAAETKAEEQVMAMEV
jgi:ribonuclease P/MRP protein subunit POP5